MLLGRNYFTYVESWTARPVCCGPDQMMTKKKLSVIFLSFGNTIWR